MSKLNERTCVFDRMQDEKINIMVVFTIVKPINIFDSKGCQCVGVMKVANMRVAVGSFDRLDEYEHDTKNMMLRLQKY